ncbi:PAS domain-containing protein [Pelagibius sp. CAU 1746]|uniref:LuxR C-terminal-related transcriptional regulator n=1 Tax=Pelagibius sp. CAU 1746 TaxID=3140370 RepID=UPI00325BEE86
MTAGFIEEVVARLPGPVFAFSTSGRLEAINDEGVELTGISRQAAQQMKLSDFIDTEERDRDFIEQFLRSPELPVPLFRIEDGKGGATSWQSEFFRLDGQDRSWLGIRLSRPERGSYSRGEATAGRSPERLLGERGAAGCGPDEAACRRCTHMSKADRFACGCPGKQHPRWFGGNLLQAIQAILRAGPQELALQAAIAEICQFSGWDYAEIWIPGGPSRAWRPHPFWFGNRQAYQGFRSRTFAAAEAGTPPLIERVASTQSACWFSDASVMPLTEYARAAAAEEAGLRATFAQPITHAGRTIAVLVFMMAKPCSRDDDLAELIGTVSSWLRKIIQDGDPGRAKAGGLSHAAPEVGGRAAAGAGGGIPPCSFDLLCTLLNSVDRPAFVVTLQHRTILWANPTACQLFGYEVGELLGRSTRILHVDQRSYEEFGKRARPFVTHDKVFRHRFWLQRKDGSRFASEHLVTPVRDLGGAQVAVSLVTDLSAPATRRFGKHLRRLSPREYDVLQLTIDGFSVKEIASRLGLSHRTVDIHRANLLKKLEVGTTTKLLAEVLAMSIVEHTQL